MRATIERLRAEFLEMPGLRLNVPQTQRLCGVDRALCQDVLDALVDVRFLCRNADGTYSRPSEGEFARRHPPAAGVSSETPLDPEFRGRGTAIASPAGGGI